MFYNPLDSKGNYSATLNNTKLVHWPLMGGLLHLVQRGGAWVGCGPPSPLLAVRNVTAHPSTTSVPITVLPYDGLLLCGFNVAIKGLTCAQNLMVSLSQLVYHTQLNRKLTTPLLCKLLISKITDKHKNLGSSPVVRDGSPQATDIRFWLKQVYIIFCYCLYNIIKLTTEAPTDLLIAFQNADSTVTD